MLKLIDRIKRKRALNGNFVRTPKGERYMNYCKKIMEGNLADDDKIQAYEDMLSSICEELDMDRVIAATLVFVFMDGSTRGIEDEY